MNQENGCVWGDESGNGNGEKYALVRNMQMCVRGVSKRACAVREEEDERNMGSRWTRARASCHRRLEEAEDQARSCSGSPVHLQPPVPPTFVSCARPPTPL